MVKRKWILPFLFILCYVLAACANDNATENRDRIGGNDNNNISSLSTNSPSEHYSQTESPNQQGQGYGNNFSPIGAQSGDTNQHTQRPNHQLYPPIPQQPNQDQQQGQGQGQEQQPGQQQQQPDQQAEEGPGATTPGGNGAAHALNDFEQAVVELTNDERRNAGLDPLEVDQALSNVAREKSRDMQANDYFSHNSPTYGSPFEMMAEFGITYRSAAENIAAGQQSPEEVVQAWMNSEGHRANILNGGFTHIGVGFEDQGNNWTQLFIRK